MCAESLKIITRFPYLSCNASFYYTVLCRVQYWYTNVVSLSVTLRYLGHIIWDTLKVIIQIITFN